MNNRKEDMEISSHYRQLLRELNEQRQHGILCDACVIVDGKIFKAHKNVLLGSSRYFKTLYCQVRERNQGGRVREFKYERRSMKLKTSLCSHPAG